MNRNTTAEPDDEIRRRFVYESPYVPAEWIAAHGFIPHILRQSGAAPIGPLAERPGICSHARAFVAEAALDSEAAGLVVTTSCDQMRRAVEFFTDRLNRKLFLMHVPATWQSAATYAYYLGELARLGEFLVRSGGVKPSDEKLVSIMEAFDERRRDMMAVHGFVKGAALTDALNAIYKDENTLPPTSETPGGVPIAVIGGPLSRTDEFVFRTIESRGGQVVLDGTQNGELMLPGRFSLKFPT